MSEANETKGRGPGRPRTYDTTKGLSRLLDSADVRAFLALTPEKRQALETLIQETK